MIVKVLGSGAGGGFPQWNCNTRLSRMAWDGDDRVSRRTQSSVAVSADSRRWVVVNASPDIRQQIQSTPELQPDRDGPKRNSPISAVVLTNGDIDHIAGLLTLRERQPFHIYATPRVLSILRANSVFGVLAGDVVERVELPLNQPIEIAGAGVMRQLMQLRRLYLKGLYFEKGSNSVLCGDQNFENFITFRAQILSFCKQIWENDIFSFRQNSAQGHNFG